MNQCDGCAVRFPVRDGLHYDPFTGAPYMACTRRRYDEIEELEDEVALLRLEQMVPQLAVEALQEARQHALDVFGSVIEAKDGNLVETFRDGTHRVLRELYFRGENK